jgi:RND family efflux transporter MFP subunit
LSAVQREDAEHALERAVLDFDSAGGRLAKARASETLARTEVERVKRLIEQMELKAPVPGRVMKIWIHAGETPAAGSSVFSLALENRMEAVLSLAPHSLEQVSLGDSVRLWGADGRMVDGRVGKISPALRPEDRLARVVVPLPGSQWAGAGASVRGEIVIAERLAVVVPTSALVALKSGPGVFRVVGGHTVATPVKVALRPGGAQAEIVEGLAEGAAYVSVASPLLRDDERIAGVLAPDETELKRTASLYPGETNR